MQNKAQEVIGLNDAITLVRLKRDINVGASKLLAMLGREFNRKERYTNTVANQQYYQLPEDGQKLKEVIVSIGGWNVPLEQVADEHVWLQMNSLPGYSGQPTHYFVKGYDQIGIYPVPSATVTNGIELVFSPKHVEMTQSDYTTGSITVTQGSQTITGTGTTFSQTLVGQWLQATDGTDENWYKVATFGDPSTLTIDNFYQGPSGSGKTFRIGQVVDIPEEFSEAPSDYACFRFYLARGDAVKASVFKDLFDSGLELAKDTYGNTTENQVIYAETETRPYPYPILPQYPTQISD